MLHPEVVWIPVNSAVDMFLDLETVRKMEMCLIFGWIKGLPPPHHPKTNMVIEKVRDDPKS